ncbi:MAG: hypothetical protein U0640_13420 [Phycisphaerales bacterium]
MATEQRLDAVPGRTVYQRLLVPRIPLSFEGNLADVRPVGEHTVEFAPGEPWRVGAIRQPLAVQAIAQGIQRQGLECIKVKKTPHIRSGGLIGYGHTPAVLPDVPIPVRRFPDEPALLDSPSQALTNIE